MVRALLNALFNYLSNTDRLGTIFRKPVPVFDYSLPHKKCFLNLIWLSFEPFPRVLSLDTRDKRSAPCYPLTFFRCLKRAKSLLLSFISSSCQHCWVITPFDQLIKLCFMSPSMDFAGGTLLTPIEPSVSQHDLFL